MKENHSSSPGLVRALGPVMATAIVVGTVIGSGVFKKPQVVAFNIPYFSLAALVWILGGVLAMMGGLTLAEIAVLYPRAGGNYVFLREAYGRMAGFLWGWVEFWIIRSASLAALAVIFAESFNDMLGNPAFQEALHLVRSNGEPLGSKPLGFWGEQLLTVSVILGLALVNVRGVRWGGFLQLFITLVKIGSLLGIMVLPFVVAAVVDPALDRPKPDPERLDPIWPASVTDIALSGVISAFLGVLWAYHGWMNIAWVAEEIRKPQRYIPIALIGGIAIIMFLYLGANLAYYLVLPHEDIKNSTAQPVATLFSMRLLGPIGAAVASAAVMCSVFGALNGNLMVGPRMLYAMGEDGLAPRALAAVHPRFHTPALAIMVMAIWACLLVVGGGLVTRAGIPKISFGDFEVDLNEPLSLFDMLTDFAMFGAVIFETMAVVSIFVFRKRFPDADRPYRCPGYPIVPALYVILPAMVLTNMFFKQRIVALVGVVFIGLGALVYGTVYRRKL